MRPTSRRHGTSPSSSARRRWSSRTMPSFYVYRLHMGNHMQTGIAACFSIDEYERDLIKKHEKTRPDKEDDRTRHMLAIGAQTGPVFLTYRASQGGRRGRGPRRDRRRRCSTSPRLTACATRSGRCRPTRTRRSSTRSRRSTRSTSPTGTTARPALRGTPHLEGECRASRPRVRGTIACWRWRSPTTRCRSCRTTASSRI